MKAGRKSPFDAYARLASEVVLAAGRMAFLDVFHVFDAWESACEYCGGRAELGLRVVGAEQLPAPSLCCSCAEQMRDEIGRRVVQIARERGLNLLVTYRNGRWYAICGLEKDYEDRKPVWADIVGPCQPQAGDIIIPVSTLSDDHALTSLLAYYGLGAIAYHSRASITGFPLVFAPGLALVAAAFGDTVERQSISPYVDLCDRLPYPFSAYYGVVQAPPESWDVWIGAAGGAARLIHRAIHYNRFFAVENIIAPALRDALYDSDREAISRLSECVVLAFTCPA